MLDAIGNSNIEITTVLCGEARGVDEMGKRWAHKNGIPVESCPANWNKYGYAAGVIRNKLMAENAEALIAVWNGYSTGTKNMIEEATEKDLRVYVHFTTPPLL